MKRFCLLLLLAVAISASFAQEYTLEQLVNYGVENATTIRQQLLSEMSSKSSLRSSYLNFLPSADVSYSAQNADGSHDYSSRLSLSKSISLSDDDWFELRREKLYFAVAELTLDDLRKQIACEVVSQYYDVLEAGRTLNILQEQYAIEQKTQEQTQILYDADKRSLLDLRQSQIDVIDARIAMQDQEQSLRNTRQNLFRLLNLADAGYTFADPQEEITPLDVKWQDPLDIQIEERSIAADRLSLKESMLNFLPQVTLSAGWNYGASGPEAADPFDTGLMKDNYSLGATVSYDLFNWFTHGESHNRQKWTLRSRQLGLDDTRTQTRIQFDQNVADWNHKRDMYDLYTQKLGLAEDNYRMAEEKYRMGMLSFLDAESVRIDYIQAQINVNSSYFGLLRLREEINLLLSRPILGKW